MVRRIELTNPLLLGEISDHEELETKEELEKKESYESYETPLFLEESLLLSPPPMNRLTEKGSKYEIATPSTVLGSVDSSDIRQASPVNAPPTELLLPSFDSGDSLSEGSPRSVILRAHFGASHSSGLMFEPPQMPTRIVLRPRMSQLERILTPKEGMAPESSLAYHLTPLLDMDLDEDDDEGQEETKEEDPDGDNTESRYREDNPPMRRIFMSSFSSGASFDTEDGEGLQAQMPLQRKYDTASERYESFSTPPPSTGGNVMEGLQEMFLSCFSCGGAPSQQPRWVPETQLRHPASSFTAADYGVAVGDGRRVAYI